MSAPPEYEVPRRRDVLDVDLDVRVHLLRTGLVARLEGLDQRHVDAADEADPAGLGLQRGRGAGEERALLGGEDQPGNVVALAGAVGQLEAAVDLREGGVRELRGDGRQLRVVGEADRDDRVVALLGQLGQQLGAVGPVLVGRDLAVLAAVLLDRGLGAGECGVVERAVAATDGVVGPPDPHLFGLGTALGAPGVTAPAAIARRLVAGARGQGHGAGQQQGHPAGAGLHLPRSAQDDLLSAGTCTGRSPAYVPVCRCRVRHPAVGPAGAHDLRTLTAVPPLSRLLCAMVTHSLPTPARV
jgi:hypothetical protein